MTHERIKYEFTTPHTSQQNGASERLNCILTEGVHTMSADLRLPHTVDFWLRLFNVCVPPKSLSHQSTKRNHFYKVYNSTKPDMSCFVYLDVLPVFMCQKWRGTDFIQRQESVCCWTMQLPRRVTIFMTLSI